jgi:hypothetical protein
MATKEICRNDHKAFFDHVATRLPLRTVILIADWLGSLLKMHCQVVSSESPLVSAYSVFYGEEVTEDTHSLEALTFSESWVIKQSH